MKYTVLKTEGRAKRAHMETVHGTVETPVFMNVGTQAAIKGGLSQEDLHRIGCQVELSNTYHLHLRPGDKVVWICHALTGNANPEDWWPTVVGKGFLFDPDQVYIVCVSTLCSPYGDKGT